MNYLLLHKPFVNYRIVQSTPDNTEGARKFFLSRGYKVNVIDRVPSKRTLRRWRQTNRARSVDGCWVVGLCSCEHGQRSLLAFFATH
jgi:hypothetical protein